MKTIPQIKFPYVDIPKHDVELIKPKDSECRIYPESLFKELINFKLIIRRDEGNINIVVDAPVSIPCEQDKDIYLLSIHPIIDNFKQSVFCVYKPVLDRFMKEHEYALNNRDYSERLRSELITYEQHMLREYRVTIKSWLQIHYGYFPDIKTFVEIVDYDDINRPKSLSEVLIDAANRIPYRLGDKFREEILQVTLNNWCSENEQPLMIIRCKGISVTLICVGDMVQYISRRNGEYVKAVVHKILPTYISILEEGSNIYRHVYKEDIIK